LERPAGQADTQTDIENETAIPRQTGVREVGGPVGRKYGDANTENEIETGRK